MANEKIRLLYGPAERVPQESSEAGRLLFTVVTPDGTGTSEGHIYYDNGKEIVHLYKTDLEALETKVKAVEAVVAELTGDEIEESLADIIQDAIEQAVKNLELETRQDYVFGSLLPGAYVTQNGKEYRVCFKSDTDWKKQTNDNPIPSYNANSYYISMKAYAPSDDVVKFKESTKRDQSDIDNETFTFDDAFAGTDENGKYSIIWLPVASFDNGSWTYLGDQSSDAKTVGWYYTVKWIDENDNIVSTDQIRISLINDGVKPTVVPAYMIDYATKEDIKNITTGGDEWGEF